MLLRYFAINATAACFLDRYQLSLLTSPFLSEEKRRFIASSPAFCLSRMVLRCPPIRFVVVVAHIAVDTVVSVAVELADVVVFVAHMLAVVLQQCNLLRFHRFLHFC